MVADEIDKFRHEDNVEAADVGPKDRFEVTHGVLTVFDSRRQCGSWRRRPRRDSSDEGLTRGRNVCDIDDLELEDLGWVLGVWCEDDVE